jgi:hypothetical protein
LLRKQVWCWWLQLSSIVCNIPLRSPLCPWTLRHWQPRCCPIAVAVAAADAEAEEAAELTWTTERLQQIGAAVEAAASVAPNPADAPADADAAAAAVDAAAAAALNPLEAAAAAVAGQLTRLVYQAASAAATTGPAAPTAGPVSTLYPTITPRQDLGFTPANLGGVFEGIDLNLMGIGHLAGFKAQRPLQPTSAEDYQLVLGVERVRVPELLYQPAALAGVDQAGFSEVLALVFQRLPRHIGDAVAGGGAVVTGGNACFAGTCWVAPSPRVILRCLMVSSGLMAGLQHRHLGKTQRACQPRGGSLGLYVSSCS